MRVWSKQVKGKRYAAKTCITHMDPELRRKRGIRWSGNPDFDISQGRAKKPTASSILRERFEADADRYLKPLEEAIQAMKAVVVGNGAHARIENVEDFSLRLRAMEVMLDRVYGKPTATTEITGAGGAPLQVTVPQDEERAREVAQILAGVGAVTVPEPTNPPVVDAYTGGSMN